ncbi:MAG TPA: MoaD/ThiS family protein [Firmicutes bacterium]|nr:MoaD/ThiS family protein [Candidatus Fermentithermobacillaceae bacterium]
MKENPAKIKVTLSAMGHSAQYFPGGSGKVEVYVTPSRTLEGILEDLGVAKDLFMFALVEDKKVGFDYVPRDGDEVVLVSPVMGG